MPYKHHQPRRDKIPRARYRVTNWPDYDRGLVRRGDIRFWVSEEALAGWAAPRRRTRGGQPRYSDLAIETVLMLATVYRLPLRQAEGFTRSLMELMDLDLAVPDHTTLARRRRTVAIEMNAPSRKAPVDLVLDSTGLKFHGPGEWDRLKHGEMRRAWRKLHIAVDAGTGEILAHVLTDSDTSDAAMAGPLVASAGGRIRTVTADGAYDGAPTYAAIRRARPPRSPPKIVIPPCKPSIPAPGTPHSGTERERHAAEIAARGRMAWQKGHDYGKRSHAETAVFRLKRNSGDRLTARTFGAQRREIAFRIAAANKAIRLAEPITVRID
ncbi:MAG: IS5 family transposase [Pseudomonadota bacterium]